MRTEDLERETKQLDQDFAFLRSRPLSRSERHLHAKARKRGRPRIGQGAEKIRVSVERGLLIQSDAFAERNHLTRSEMIARGLRAVLAAVGEA